MQAMSLVFWDRNLVLIEQRLEWIFSWGRGKGKKYRTKKETLSRLGRREVGKWAVEEERAYARGQGVLSELSLHSCYLWERVISLRFWDEKKVKQKYTLLAPVGVSAFKLPNLICCFLYNTLRVIFFSL